MKKDHMLFMIFLILTFIAPKVPANLIIDAPERSTISLGFIGLAAWVVFSPGTSIIGLRRLSNSYGLLLVLFAAYGFFVSFLSIKLISIAYSLQYLSYTMVGLIVLRGYFIRCIKLKEVKVAFKIITLVGIIFSLGIIVSIINGPLYPHQVQWTAKIIDGVRVERGVGFAENVNGAAATMLFFVPFVIFLNTYQDKIRRGMLLVFLSGIALLCTLSRSAFFSLVVSLLVVGYFLWLRIMIKRLVSREKARFAVSFILISVILIIVFFSVFFVLVENNYKEVLLSLFGIGNNKFIANDVFDRFSIWANGIKQIAKHNDQMILFGQGFRSSQTINEYGVWNSPHNVYIAFLGDFGVLGLLLFLACLVGSMISAFCNIIISKNAVVGYFFLVSLMSLSIHNLSEAFFYSPLVVILLLIMLNIFEFRDQISSQILTDAG